MSARGRLRPAVAPGRLGLVAEFDDAEGLRAAAHLVREAGCTRVDAYTPFDDAELGELLGYRRTRIPWLVGLAALAGAAGAYALQWWASAVAYPLNVGGRPTDAVLAFVPITFETAILCGSLAAFVALWARSGLPELWHPLFEIDGFERASVDRWWLAVGADDPSYDAAGLSAMMERSGALRVLELRGADE